MAVYDNGKMKLSLFFRGYEDGDADWLYYEILVETKDGLVFPKRDNLSTMYVKDDLKKLIQSFKRVISGLNKEEYWMPTEMGCTQIKIIKLKSYYKFEVIEELLWGNLSASFLINPEAFEKFYQELNIEALNFIK